MDGYSYDGDHEACVDPSEWKDPITVAFVYGAAPAVVDYHGRAYGDAWGDDDDEQRFYDHGRCGFEDVDLSNHEEFPPRGRYHMRAHTATNGSGGWDEDPQWGVFSVATPHRDEPTLDCVGESGHIVPEEYYGVSGFVAGRQDVLERWVTNGDHYIAAWDYWYNTAAILQCDEENEPASAGWVAYVAMGDTDGDGCSDEQELGPDPALGGQRDPLNYYDFYDITDITGVVGAKDRAVTGFDLSLMLVWGNAFSGGGPNANGKDYDVDGNTPLGPPQPNGIADGLELDYAGVAGPATGPDGGISGFDLGALLAQGGDSCADID